MHGRVTSSGEDKRAGRSWWEGAETVWPSHGGCNRSEERPQQLTMLVWEIERESHTGKHSRALMPSGYSQ